MRLTTPLILLCLLVLAGTLPARVTHAAPAPKPYFHECAYKFNMYGLTRSTAKLFNSIVHIRANSFHQQAQQQMLRINAVERKFAVFLNPQAKRIDRLMRDAIQLAGKAADGHDIGANAIYNRNMKFAWPKINTIYKLLKPICPLGHPLHTLIDGRYDGTDFNKGVLPTPLAPPWLSVSKAWEIFWSYNCSHRTFGFVVEVRSVTAKIALAVTNTSTYLGPLRATPIKQHNRIGHGRTQLPGIGGPVYLIVRSQCQFTLQIQG